ncbi:hypothetical protein [Schlesneria paludicola]|uniref:hypothetical protein n=1 Tax=Schlesneria paludicola TaxID=360056 RepID=UPI0012F7D8AE|nr:hypothetical protein [Schlesneria paludicola]
MIEKHAKALDGLELIIATERVSMAETSNLPVELQILNSPSFLEPESYLVRIDGRRFFQRLTQGSSGVIAGEATFNGKILFSGRPPASGVESLLTIDTVDRSLGEAKRKATSRNHFFWTYFEEAGYHLPASPREIGEPTSSLVLHLAKQGRVISWSTDSEPGGLHDVTIEAPDPWSRRKMTPDQITAAVAHLRTSKSRERQSLLLQRLSERSELNPTRLYRFSLDPAIGFAVRSKWEMTLNRELLFHSSCEDFVKLPDRDLWIPKVIQTLVHASDLHPTYIAQSPIQRITNSVEKVTPKSFGDSDFELWYDAPGGSVFDYTAKDATADTPVTYNVPAKTSDLARAAAVSGLGFTPTRLLIALNVVFAISIAVWLWRNPRGAK